MSTPIILPLAADGPDFERVTGWLQDTFGHHDGSDLARTQAWVREAIADDGEVTLVARASGEALGTVSVIASDLDGFEHLTPWLAGLYVAPEARSGGLGVTLVKAACAWAHGRGVRRLHLYAERPSVTRFYDRLGWHRLCDTDVAGTPQSIMTLDLD